MLKYSSATPRVGEVIQGIAAKLLDKDMVYYTRDVLYPHYLEAWDELIAEFATYHVQTIQKTNISITLPANSTSLGATGSGAATESSTLDGVLVLNHPIRRRQDGELIEMNKVSRILSTNTVNLDDYSMAGDILYFYSGDQSRELVIDYLGEIAAPVNDGDPIGIKTVYRFLVNRAAVIAANALGHTGVNLQEYQKTAEKALVQTISLALSEEGASKPDNYTATDEGQMIGFPRGLWR